MAMATSCSTYIGVCARRIRNEGRFFGGSPVVDYDSRLLWKSQRRGCSLRSVKTVAALRPIPGFGKQAKKVKPRILKELDVEKVEAIKYDIFVRKIAGEEPVSEWQGLGDIFVEEGNSVEIALKERRETLAGAVDFQYPDLATLQEGELLQYGIRVSSPENAAGVKDQTGTKLEENESKAEQVEAEGSLKGETGGATVAKEEQTRGEIEGNLKEEQTGEGEKEGGEKEEIEGNLTEEQKLGGETEVQQVEDGEKADAEIIALDLGGKLPKQTVPAKLRVADGKALLPRWDGPVFS